MINNTNDKVFINNRVFKDCKNMSATAFYVYIGAKVHQIVNNENVFSLHELYEEIGIAKSTLIKNIKELIPLGYFKENNTYNSSINQFKTYSALEPKDDIHGFTCIDMKFLKELISLVKNNKLNKRHLQIFLFLIYKEQENSKTWKLSQSYISMGLGVTRNAIHISLKILDLEVVNYLQKTHNVCFEYIYNFLVL